jgi:hypothetical protein
VHLHASREQIARTQHSAGDLTIPPGYGVRAQLAPREGRQTHSTQSEVPPNKALPPSTNLIFVTWCLRIDRCCCHIPTKGSNQRSAAPDYQNLPLTHSHTFTPIWGYATAMRSFIYAKHVGRSPGLNSPLASNILAQAHSPVGFVYFHSVPCRLALKGHIPVLSIG